MSNTYRAVNRDHRVKVAVTIASARRAPLTRTDLQCEFSPSCGAPATVTISARGIPAVFWPTVCTGHAAAYR